MRNPVIIVHGWSDSSKSFEALAQKLIANGFHVKDLWLGDYISKDDTVSISDIAKRMEEVLQSDKFLLPGQTFDAVVHSTGGLVVRHWLTMFDRGRGRLKRLVMLAPANFGSGLAVMGKSMLGRITKGFDNWLQTGTEILNSLELGSPYQWQLANQDLFESAHGLASSSNAPIYDEAGCLPFVLTGTKGYSSLLRRALNEDGADGTVRAASANLSAYGLTLDFSNDSGLVGAEVWTRQGKHERFAFRILPREDHSSIVTGESADTFTLIKKSLDCPMSNKEYKKLVDEWLVANEAVFHRDDAPNRHYFQLNTFVVDDQGNHVPDHFIEFIGEKNTKENNDMALDVFQRFVLKKADANSINLACKTFYLDRTALMEKFYQNEEAGTPSQLRVSISASPPGPHSRYFDSTKIGASGDYTLHLEDDMKKSERWLRRHSTHFLKIVIPRRPTAAVFKLRSLTS
jgi:pimeloyl-ACP methyl ester carboxylesterase